MFTSSSILTMKIVLMSSGILSLAFAVKHTLIPLIVHFTVSDLPTVWSVFLLMFKPPYLYVLFNGIIIIIYAISRFTQNQTQPSSPHSTSTKHEVSQAIVVPPPRALVVEELPEEVWDEKTAVVVDGLEVDKYFKAEEEVEKVVVEEAEEEVVEPVEDLAWEAEVVSPATKKPSEFTAFPAHKQSNLNPEGRRSNKHRVTTKHQRHQTLDSTWKMITQGRHLTSSVTDTFENVENQNMNSSLDQNSLFRKSATFKDRTNILQLPALGSNRIVRKESSLEKEELNQRVEAFIKKFNDDMRLQREDSYKRYLEMINHG